MNEIISFHRMLLNDSQRMEAYHQAIAQAVQPGNAVLDVGTGSGILAFFACQAGAERVYAVDRTEAILLAKELARENGFSDRITFVQGDLRTAEIPEKVDVIVSELISRGVLGQQQETLISLARDQFLKPGGRLVPERVDLCVAPVEVDEPDRSKITLPKRHTYDLDFKYMNKLLVNQLSSARLKPENLLARPQVAYRHEAKKVTCQTSVDASMTFEINRTGTLHALGCWFEATLAEGITLANAPPTDPLGAWSNALLPVEEPVEVATDTKLTLELRASDTPQRPQFWLWNVSIIDGSANAVCNYKQSTFFGELWTPERMRQRHTRQIPSPSEAARVDHLILSLMDGTHSCEAIAERVVAQFPMRYPEVSAARNHVMDLANRYG